MHLLPTIYEDQRVMQRHAFAVGGFVALILLFLSGDPVASQNRRTGQKPAEPPQPVFKVPVDVVVVSATVTDGKGAPVLGLTVDDFKIYEDGKPQPIHTFALESYKATQPVDAEGRKPGHFPEGQASEPSQSRLFSIVIDDLTTARQYYPAITQAVRKFVDEDLATGDQVAIASSSSRVQHPFTTDRQLLHAELGDLYRKLDVSTASRSTCPTLTDLQAQRIALGTSDFDSLSTAVNVAFRIYNLSGSAEQPEQLKLVAEPKLIGENGVTQALRAVALDPNHLYPAGNSETMVALSLPFADVTPGRYKLVLATSEGATNRSVILEADLQIR